MPFTKKTTKSIPGETRSRIVPKIKINIPIVNNGSKNTQKYPKRYFPNRVCNSRNNSARIEEYMTANPPRGFKRGSFLSETELSFFFIFELKTTYSMSIIHIIRNHNNDSKSINKDIIFNRLKCIKILLI